MTYSDDLFGGVQRTDIIPIETIDKDLRWAIESDYRTLHTIDEVKAMIVYLQSKAGQPTGLTDTKGRPILEMPAVDTETKGLHGDIVGASFSIDDKIAFYVPFQHNGYEHNLPLQETMEVLKPFLEGTPCVYANASYDWQVFHKFGIDCNIGDDTLLMSFVYDVTQNSHGLKQQTKLRLGRESIEISELFPKPKGRKKVDIDFSTLDPDADSVRIYACCDAANTYSLRKWFAPKMAEVEFIYNVERTLIKCMATMEENGFRVNKAILEEQNIVYKKELEEDLAELYRMFGKEIAINSPKQLAQVLYEDLGLPVLETTKTGAPSTSSKVLQRLADDYPVVKKLIDYKSKQKLQTAFLEKLPNDVGPDGRIHPSFKQAGAKSGRIACQSPNLMQIPKKGGSFIRKAFIPAEGHYIFDIDYSQIEYRIFSSMAQEDTLMNAFLTGEDFHTKTASLVFNIPTDQVSDAKRKLGKIANFAILYGVTPFGLAKQMSISETEAETIMARYFANAPHLQEYVEVTKQQALRKGYIKTYFGRKRELPELKIPALKEKTLRKAVNTTIQGTAADMLKIAMCRVYRLLNEKYKDSAKLLVCVHDELVFEVRNDIDRYEFAEDIKKCMEIQLPGFVPIVADAEWGPDWGSLEPLIDGTKGHHKKHEEEEVTSSSDDEDGEDGEPTLGKVDIDTSVLADLAPMEMPQKDTVSAGPCSDIERPCFVISLPSLSKDLVGKLKVCLDELPVGNYNLFLYYKDQLLRMNTTVSRNSSFTEICARFNAEVKMYEC